MSSGKTDWKRSKLALTACTTASVEGIRSFGYGDVYGAAKGGGADTPGKVANNGRALKSAAS